MCACISLSFLPKLKTVTTAKRRIITVANKKAFKLLTRLIPTFLKCLTLTYLKTNKMQGLFWDHRAMTALLSYSSTEYSNLLKTVSYFKAITEDLSRNGPLFGGKTYNSVKKFEVDNSIAVSGNTNPGLS